jgi:hypothetical protein
MRRPAKTLREGGGSEVIMEKLYIRLERPIPGKDHIKAIDPERFAELHGRWDDVAQLLDVDRINDFYVYEGEHGKYPVRWHRAAKALKAIRALLEYYRSGKGELSDERRQQVIQLFETVETILDDADLRGIRFCFVGDC